MCTLHALAVPLPIRLGIAALLVPGVSPGPAWSQIPQADDGVRAGDMVTIEFFTAAGVRPAELSGEHTVDRDGQLVLPYVGRISVQGLNALEMRELLTQRFSQFYENPILVVRVQLTVNVTGVVRIPGHYLVDPSATLVDALARAGGVLEELGGGSGQLANSRSVRLVRGGRTHVVDLRPDALTREISDLRVQSGDWLHVPPAPRSRWRDNLQLAASMLTVAASVIFIAAR
ncbi:MAG: polysaccharide biosynthesis/export family protein [Gemmatimonadetes bacterium]|nr:polysaccharide biosynthesis/export family protein [Gemmatimonadota bacterium]